MAKAKPNAGIGDAAVLKATGKPWTHWLKTLDAFDVRRHGHQPAANHIHTLGVPGWWAQMIVVRYEQHRGLREVGQQADGYSASASRTIAAPIGRVYRMFADDTSRAHWLNLALDVSTKTKDKSLRAAAPAGSRVEVNFYRKTLKDGSEKCMVQVQQNKLASAKARDASKKLWSTALDRLERELST